jgi:NAD(P)-dependent dehydrogenase (short-subunit alcohol dehydrogenase family)
MAWKTDEMGDCTGRRVVITGANSGIGLEAAKDLVTRGATVTLACRDLDKAKAAAAGLSGPGEARVRHLDLADLQSVRDFAAECGPADGPLDGLIANAGVMACPFRLSTDGYELQMATNHIGHALLVGLLWEALAPAARVVLVSSLAARGGKLTAATTVDDLVQPTRYLKQQVYNNTKQANLLFAEELDRRAKAAGKDVVVVAAHPGVSYSELFPRQMRDAGHGWLVPILRPILWLVLQPTRAGALPLLRALTDKELKGGELIGPKHLGGSRGAPEHLEVFKTGTDPAVAAHLWQLTEQILEHPILP